MTRFVSKLAVSATAVALTTLAAAPAFAADSVDANTGPVSYAFPGQYALQNVSNAKLYRSPLQAGVSGPDEHNREEDQLAVSPDPGDGANSRASWEIRVNSAAPVDRNRPAGVPVKPQFTAAAALNDTQVPGAVMSTDYEIMDSTFDRGVTQDSVVYFDGVRSAAECDSPTAVHADSTVNGLYVRQANGQLTKVALPAGGSYTSKSVPASAPDKTPDGTDRQHIFADITVSKITKTDGLIKTPQWRTGDVNAAAGWRIDVAHYYLKGLGQRVDFAKTSMVAGGVSCSIPKDFVAKPKPTSTQPVPTTQPGTPGKPTAKPTVPVKIPAGGDPAAAAPAENSSLPYVLGGGGALVVVAAGAAFAARRRRTVDSGSRD